MLASRVSRGKDATVVFSMSALPCSKIIKESMSELRRYFQSLIRNAEECGADTSFLQMDLGAWQARLVVCRKKENNQQ